MGLNVEDIATLKNIGINVLILAGVTGFLIWVSVVMG